MHVCKEEDGVEIEMWMARSKLWRTEIELPTETDEGCLREKLEVQTERTSVQMLIQTEKTEVSEPLRAKRRTEL